MRWIQQHKTLHGYEGPTVHFWEHNLLFTGPQTDWRYEGLMIGYLERYISTGQRSFLELAKEAGDMILSTQLPNGCFLNSSFQHGAMEGNTPHEAAVDIALLRLAQVLKQEREPYMRYVSAAKVNLEKHYVKRLWTGKGFADTINNPVLVPNKNATAAEAFHLLSLFTKVPPYFVQKAIRVVTDNQVKNGPSLGATVHLGSRGNLRIGIYTARCMSALSRIDTDRFQHQIDSSWEFLHQLVHKDGTYFGHTAEGKLLKTPCWVAPSAEFVGAIDPAKISGKHRLKSQIYGLIKQGQLRSGGVRTAWTPNKIQQFCDILPCIGWNDKVFRYVPDKILRNKIAVHKEPAILAGKKGKYYENEEVIAFKSGEVLYQYTKRQPFATHYGI